jgi:prepilin-type N-terminal cleavage/methylation domain-containing protein
MQRRRSGFTLIELLIVVVIIGILASIAIPKFSNTKEKAYIASMKSDLKNLGSAMESYYTDNNSTYAPNATALGTAFKASAGVTVTITGVGGSSWRATATHALVPNKRCRTAYGTSRTYDATVICT